MRIVGGSVRGTALATPKTTATRPTPDRVRQAVFNILGHGVAGFSFEGARVLDLFAGTGALGLEALSRGCPFAVFIDEDAAARALIRANIERTHMVGRTRISRRDGANLGPVGKSAPFDLAFADPPYGQGLGMAAAASALKGGWLNRGAVFVVEDARGADFIWPEEIEAIDEREYGGTAIHIGRVVKTTPS